VPFRLLKPIDKLSVGDDSGSLLVQGDSLAASQVYGNGSTLKSVPAGSYIKRDSDLFL
jgi:hypothetical protein